MRPMSTESVQAKVLVGQGRGQTLEASRGPGRAGRLKGDPAWHTSRLANVPGGCVCPGGSLSFNYSLHIL